MQVTILVENDRSVEQAKKYLDREKIPYTISRENHGFIVDKKDEEKAEKILDRMGYSAGKIEASLKQVNADFDFSKMKVGEKVIALTRYGEEDLQHISKVVLGPKVEKVVNTDIKLPNARKVLQDLKFNKMLTTCFDNLPGDEDSVYPEASKLAKTKVENLVSDFMDDLQQEFDKAIESQFGE